MKALEFLGLGCIALVFVRAGLVHFVRFGEMRQMLERRRWPLPGLLLAAGSLLQIAAGAGLLFAPVRAGAAVLLALFTVAASIGLLDFWRLTGTERAMMMGTFLNNMALAGGLLVISVRA